MHNSNNSISTKQFLEAIFSPFFRSSAGFIEVRQINHGKVTSRFFPSVDTLMEQFESFKGNTYFGAGARNNESGKKEAVKILTCFWVDIDYGQDGHRKKSWYATKEEALSGVYRFPIPPSIIVHSGNGYHCYWLLDRAVKIPTPDKAESILKALIINLGGDSGTHDLSRILRLPGTLNTKDNSNHKKAEIVQFNETTKYPTATFKELVEKTSTIEPLSSDTRKLILNGHACSTLPSRSETDFRVLCELLKANVSDNKIKEIFEFYPIGEKYRESGVQYLEHSIKKAKESQANEKGTFFETQSPRVIPIARKLIEDNALLFSGGIFFNYQNGVYRILSPEELKKRVIAFVGDSITRHKINEIVEHISTLSHINEIDLNTSPLLNLTNGLFDLNNNTLLEHSPDIKTTTQLKASFRPGATCPFWIKSINEMLLNDLESIRLLQEFFGLCLTKITKFEKALILVGDGANGKSVVVHILSKLLGSENCSAIPLEKFNNSHYIAGLFGKLANISIESPANMEIYDSTFKAIVSGDDIQADHKFGKPFKFPPFCKLVIALNTLPRVSDKTDGYFRRLLILRFPHQFAEQDQDKLLKHKLEDELDGILLWALEGLKRLLEREHFAIPQKTAEEIREYRLLNNSVLAFVSEECVLSGELEISKADLYRHYQTWCNENGQKPLSKKRVGQEILRHCPVVDHRDAWGRYFKGVGLQKLNEKESSMHSNDVSDL